VKPRGKLDRVCRRGSDVCR